MNEEENKKLEKLEDEEVPTSSGKISKVVIGEISLVDYPANLKPFLLIKKLDPMEKYSHNSKLADSEPSWGSVDKTTLPRIAFADKGEAEKKSTWKYPHHWIENPDGVDDNGISQGGKMYLHKGGLNAAWSAANGARSGEEASSDVINHLKKHRDDLGLEKSLDKNKIGDKEMEPKNDKIEQNIADKVEDKVEEKGIVEEPKNLEKKVVNESKPKDDDIISVVKKLTDEISAILNVVKSLDGKIKEIEGKFEKMDGSVGEISKKLGDSELKEKLEKFEKNMEEFKRDVVGISKAKELVEVPVEEEKNIWKGLFINKNK